MHPGGAGIRLLAVLNLTAYFDESGTHLDSKVVVLAGYVAPEREWRRLEIKWRKALIAEGVPYFHTTDVEACQDKYAGWSRERAARFHDRMAHIAGSRQLQPFGFSLLTDDLDHAFDGRLKRLAPKKAPDFAYNLLVANCLKIVLGLAARLYPKEHVAFVFEDNDFSGGVLDGYQAIKSQKPSDRFGPLVFEAKERFTGLQAADLLAWHIQRRSNILHGFRTGTEHRNLSRVARDTTHIREIERAPLRSFIRARLREMPDITREP